MVSSVFKRLRCGSSPALFHLSPNSLFFSHKIPAYRLMGEKDEVLFELEQMVLPNNLIQHIGDRNPIKDSNISENPLCAGNFQSEGKFLKHKISTDDFAAGQVWAIYCGKDIMPRQYAVVNNLVSNRQFSHLVKYVQGATRPRYIIYPQKGEIWAMYKNWNRKWERTDYETCQFWMVEVISDFSENNGIEVAKIEERTEWLELKAMAYLRTAGILNLMLYLISQKYNSQAQPPVLHCSIILYTK
ncbi:hypothetical protein VNO77_09649 [Canavalia gladiata]|uniref:DUF3444 domain-containing protein n=1 Tax=Canavalia gladiata TaxID=3824 RepID=A0AAN9MG38_CANGL